MPDVPSFVNTDVNCWFRISAFFKMSLWLTSIDERVATPLASQMKITLDKEVGLGFLGVPCLAFAQQVVNIRRVCFPNILAALIFVACPPSLSF